MDSFEDENSFSSVILTLSNGSEDKHFKKYTAILRRCTDIQKENEMVVNRIYHVKKMLRKIRKERKFLMLELDKYNDNYRNQSLTVTLEETDARCSSAEGAVVPPVSQNSRNKVAVPSSSKPGSLRKQGMKRGDRPERDPAAPKRPSNAFLQYCQEHRESVQAMYRQQTGTPIDKKELTKKLANQWNELSQDDKKIYQELFEKDRLRYSKEMKVYEAQNLGLN